MSRFKLGVRQGEGFVPHAHGHAYRLELDESGPPRIVAAPDRDQVGLLIELSRTLPEPFHVVYVLLSMRTLRPPGRYQSTRPVSRTQLESFLATYRAFLEEDGRHHLWIGSAAEPSTLAYDHHQVLYLYGRLDEYRRVLGRAGMGEGPVIVPGEHQHASHDELDGEEHALFACWNWTWNPLEPEDDPLE